MGLFSSKKKHFVDTSVNRVVEDDMVPQTAKEALITAVMDNRSIAEEMTERMLQSPAMDFERMYKYGRDHYTFGLPNTALVSNSDNIVPVRNLLEQIHGTEVSIIYAEMGPLENSHYAYDLLVDEYGYNPDSNELTVLSQEKGTTVWLQDVKPIVSSDILADAEPGSLTPYQPGQGWYTPAREAQSTYGLGQYVGNSNVVEAEDDQRNGALVTITWGGGQTEDRVLHFDESIDFAEDYFQVRYRIVQTGQTLFMTYRRGSGGYPVLDRIHDFEYSGSGTYFPFVIFRRDDENRTAEKYHDTQEYKTASKMLDYLGMDYQDIGDSIHQNPDISDIEQAFMMMAVPMETDDPIELRYLWAFFDQLYDAGADQPGVSASGAYVPFQSAKTRSYNALYIGDADFRMSLSYRGIYRKLVPGKLGPVGTYKGAKGSREYSYQVQVQKHEGKGEYSYSWKTKTDSYAGYYLRRQITPSTYEEYFVFDPRMRYEIYKGKSASADLGDDRLLIPLDRALCDAFNIQDKEHLYTRSLHFIFNSRVTEKVKWYESGLFRFVLTAIAIVITIYSLGQTYPALAAAFAAGGIAGLAWAVAVVVVKAIAIQQGFKLAAKELGAEFALVAAVALAIYGGFQGLRHGSIKGAPYASEAIQASNGLVKAAQDQYAADIAAIVEEGKDFLNQSRELMEEIEEVNDLLDTKSLLNPLEFVGLQPAFIAGESPDDFYNRTVHSGNIGTVGFDAIHRHAELGLRLPTFQDTMGGTFYG